MLEFCEGGDLYDCMRRPAGTPPGFTMSIGTGIAAALAYLHKNRMMHRDIKSPNVLLQWEGAHRASSRSKPDTQQA